MIYMGRIGGRGGAAILRRLATLEAWRRASGCRAASAQVVILGARAREFLIVINGWGCSVCLN